MDNFNQIIENQKQNFNNLEAKLEVIRSKCNEKTFTKEFEACTGVAKASKIEQYTLDDGLKVYLMYNFNNELINMWVSATNLFKEDKFVDRFGGEYAEYRFNGGSGIEYSFGGHGNSLLFGSNFYLNKQIGLIENVDGKLTKVASTIPTMIGGYDLQFLTYRNISINPREVSIYQQNCDIEGLIKNCQPRQNDTTANIDGYKLCLDMIDNIVKKNNKKSFLKQLLEKFKRNNNVIDKKNKGVNHR